MRQEISPKQAHESGWCAYTNIRVALFFVAFSGWAVFMNWKNLNKPISPPGSIELPFYILVVVLYVPLFMKAFRCFSERLVIGISAVHIAMAVASWFVPGIFNPIGGLVGPIFLTLWIGAFLLSLNMGIQALRNPYVAPEGGEVPRAKNGLLIVGAMLAFILLLGALLYFVPVQ